MTYEAGWGQIPNSWATLLKKPRRVWTLTSTAIEIAQFLAKLPQVHLKILLKKHLYGEDFTPKSRSVGPRLVDESEYDSEEEEADLGVEKDEPSHSPSNGTCIFLPLLITFIYSCIDAKIQLYCHDGRSRS